MSTSDLNSSVTVTATPSLTTVSVTPEIPVTTVRTPNSQPPPTPQPPSYRAIAPPPLHHPNPLQQAHNNHYVQSIPFRRPNQDQSGVSYPFAHPVPGPGRGLSSRPVRMSSPFVADPSGNQSGFLPRSGFPYNPRQFGPAQIESMMQFRRGINPQIHQFPHPGSGSPVGSSPMRGVPHFLQPRVAPPPTSILDTSRNKNARKRDSALVLVRGRKVKITDGASLYSLGRSWLRNGAHEGIQTQRSDTMKPLPKPLPMYKMEASVPNDPAEEPTNEDKEDEEAVKQLSEKDLLKRHIEQAKKVRARLKQERVKKIARYKSRLALLLPQPGEF
ncbi:hypothetical protein AALP_AA1G045900 [Arabis alpina]|uniref:Proline-rich family protein n=1 Tax=Arabis alpina TaxID=50452 RepID=A0A087HL39_ARAAL|nr:hypothetical protein AALP_AA1G045900 [Arabis alpina]